MFFKVLLRASLIGLLLFLNLMRHHSWVLQLPPDKPTADLAAGMINEAVYLAVTDALLLSVRVVQRWLEIKSPILQTFIFFGAILGFLSVVRWAKDYEKLRK